MCVGLRDGADKRGEVAEDKIVNGNGHKHGMMVGWTGFQFIVHQPSTASCTAVHSRVSHLTFNFRFSRIKTTTHLLHICHCGYVAQSMSLHCKLCENLRNQQDLCGGRFDSEPWL